MDLFPLHACTSLFVTTRLEIEMRIRWEDRLNENRNPPDEGRMDVTYKITNNPPGQELERSWAVSLFLACPL